VGIIELKGCDQMNITIEEKAMELIKSKGAEDLVVDIQKCGG